MAEHVKLKPSNDIRKFPKGLMFIHVLGIFCGLSLSLLIYSLYHGNLVWAGIFAFICYVFKPINSDKDLKLVYKIAGKLLK